MLTDCFVGSDQGRGCAVEDCTNLLLLKVQTPADAAQDEHREKLEPREGPQKQDCSCQGPEGAKLASGLLFNGFLKTSLVELVLNNTQVLVENIDTL